MFDSGQNTQLLTTIDKFLLTRTVQRSGRSRSNVPFEQLAETTPRDDPLYKRGPDEHGHYRCPFCERERNGIHCRTKQRCIYL